MSKKLISIFMSIVVAASLAACTNTTSNTEKKAETTTESQSDEKDKALEGTWAKNYSLEQTQKLYKDRLAKIESITKESGLKYSKDEKVKRITVSQ